MIKKIFSVAVGVVLFYSLCFAQVTNNKNAKTIIPQNKIEQAQAIQSKLRTYTSPAMSLNKYQQITGSSDFDTLRNDDDNPYWIFFDTDYNASRFSFAQSAKACTLKEAMVAFSVPMDSLFYAQDCSLFVWKNSNNNTPGRRVLAGTFAINNITPGFWREIYIDISFYDLTFASDFWIGYKKTSARAPLGLSDSAVSYVDRNAWRSKIQDTWKYHSDGDFLIGGVVSNLPPRTGPAILLHTSINFFNDTDVGGQSSWVLEVSNIGTSELNISEISSSNAVFSVDLNTFSVAPDNLQELMVTFSPADTGTAVGRLDIKSNDPDYPILPVYLVGIGIDLTAPMITFDPSSVVSPDMGNAASVENIFITDNDSVAKAYLFYRKGGTTAFSSVELQTPDRKNFKGSLPASAITTRGVEYYFKAVDTKNNISCSPTTDPENHPYILIVNIPNLTKPTAQPAESYRMISVPINLNSAAPDNVLVDDLDEYDDTIWRLFRWQGSDYVEYTRGNIAEFASGKAFWLITKDAKTIDSGPGKSVTTGSNFIITLQPGWNMIGGPFDFEINWSDVIKDNSVESSLWWYDGQGYLNKTRLEPWEGYFVKNRENYNVNIEIPPRGTGGSAKSAAECLAVNSLSEEEWSIQIAAQAGKYSDSENYLGKLTSSHAAWDQHDFSEPPQPPGEYISLYFPHQNWEKYPGSYTTDFRPIAGEGEVWDFIVDGNIAESKCSLVFDKLSSVPENLEVFLFDQARQIAIDLRSNNQYTFNTSTGKRFSIMVGTNQFVAKNKLTISPVPEQYALGQNYPNPFNSVTTIKYEVPKHSKIILKIFNVMGQELATLVNEYQDAGYHTVHWDASQAPTGIYFCQVHAEGFVQIRKMILQR